MVSEDIVCTWMPIVNGILGIDATHFEELSSAKRYSNGKGLQAKGARKGACRRDVPERV